MVLELGGRGIFRLGNVVSFLLISGTFACGPIEGDTADIQDEGIDLRTATPAGLETEGAAFSQKEQSFSTSSCATASANKTDTGSLAFTTPRSYDTCYKGYVADMLDTDFLLTMEAPNSAGNGNPGIKVAYGDTSITTKTACESTHLGVILYTRSSPSQAWQPVFSPAKLSKTGSWVQQYQPGIPEGSYYWTCDLSYFFYGFAEGVDYRFAVTSRNSADETRKVKFTSRLAYIIR